MQVINAMGLKAGKKAEYNRMGSITQPLQFLSKKDKDPEWKAWNMDWLEWNGLKQLRKNAGRIMKNYKLAKGTIDRSDYIPEDSNEMKDIVDTLAQQDLTALDLKFYPLVPNIINVMTAEFAKRNTKITFRGVDEYTYNEQLEEKNNQVTEVLLKKAEQKMLAKLLESGMDPNDPEMQQQMQQQLSPENLKTLPEIQSYFDKDYRSMCEQWAIHQYKIDEDRFSMDELEERAFRDMLISDREFWHFKMNEDDYDVELWNPVTTFYHKSPEARYISQGNWVGKVEMMTVADVIDKYGYLTVGDNGGDIMNWILGESEDYTPMGSSFLLRTTTAYWKSQRKVGHLTKITEEGEVLVDIITDDYKVTDKPMYDTTLIRNKTKDNLIFGEHIDWIWINQVWGGVKIGPNQPSFWGMNNPGGINPMYLGIDQNAIGPLKFQFKGDNSLYGSKLPVEGAVFNDRNTRSTSMVDLMKPFQIGYTEHPIANQAFQSLNLEQTQRLLSRIQLANYFKQQCYELVGVSPQRLGQQIGQTNTATGIEQAVVGSYAQTEIYFIQHSDRLMPRVHQMRTDLAQYYQSKKPSIRLQYMTSADEKVNFEMNGTDLLLRDINIFCTTKANQRAILEQMKQLAVSNNTAGASIYDLGTIMQTESLGELTIALKSIDKKASAKDQAERESAEKMQQEQIEASIKEKQMQLDHDMEEAEKNRRKDILIAEIKSAGYGAMQDINANKQSDYLDALGQIQKSEQFQESMNLQTNKEASQTANNRERAQIEREKMSTSMQMKQMDLQIAKENKNKFDVKAKKEAKKK